MNSDEQQQQQQQQKQQQQQPEGPFACVPKFSIFVLFFAAIIYKSIRSMCIFVILNHI